MAEAAVKLVKRGPDVVLADRSGNLVSVPEADVGAVLSEGTYLPATPQQVAERDRDKKYGGALGQVAAGAAALPAGAFDAAVAIPKAATALGSRALGVKDPLAGIHGRGLEEDLVYLAGEAQGRSGEADVRKWREAVHGVAEANPITTTIGRVGGEILGSAGLGAAGRGVGSLAARGAAGVGGGATAQLLARGAAAGATEGALLAQGQVAEEAYLSGDRETTAEKTLAGMGIGALFGGGVGLGLAGAQRVFGRAGSRGATPVDSPAVGNVVKHERELDNAAARVLGVEPAPGLGSKLRDAIESVQSAASGAEKSAISEFGALNWSESAKSGRALWRNREAILEGATKEITDRVDDLLKKSKAVTREVWEVPAKEAQVTANLAKASEEAQATMLGAARDASSKLRADMASLTEAVGPGANKRYLADLTTWLGGVDNAVAQGDAGAAYIALDRAKRAMQNKVDTLGATLRSETNPLMLEQKRAVLDALEGAQDNVRQFLMDETVWGAQGTAQREANAAAERYLKVNRMFEQSFATKMGREYGGAGGRPIFDANPEAVSRYVQTLGRQEAALKDRIFREYVDSTLNLAESIGKGYTLEGPSAKALNDLRGAARSIKETLGKADKTVKVANQIDAVIEAERGGASGLLGSTFGGGLLGGAPGAMLGAAFGVATRPGQMIRQMAAIEQLTKNVDGKLARGLRGFVEGFGAAKLPRLPGGELARETARELPKRALIPSALEVFRGKEATAASAYEKRSDELMALDPERLLERTHAALGDLPVSAPRLSADIAGKAARAVEFLRTKLPPRPPPTVFDPTRKALPSDLEIAQFARYWTAVTNPLSVLEELKVGTLTSEHVEAVQFVYPKLYQHMQIAALDSMRMAAERKIAVPYQARIQLGMLLNLGPAADPTLDPGLMVRVSGYMAQQQPKSGASPRSKPAEVSNRLRSPAESRTLRANEA